MGQDVQGKESRALRELKTAFEDEATALEKNWCEFVSRGMLKCRLTEGLRRIELRRMGFHISETGDAVEENLWGLFLAILAYFVFMMTVFGPKAIPQVEHRITLAVMIASSYMVAIVSALHFAGRDERTRDRIEEARVRPFRSYLEAGLVAGVCATILSLAWSLTLTWNLIGALSILRRTWPWSLLAFATSFITRFNFDTRTARNTAWLEGLGQGVVSALVVGAVIWLLNQVWQTTGVCKQCEIPYLPKAMFNGLVVGFGIGFCVPRWYRMLVGGEGRGPARLRVDAVIQGTAGRGAHRILAEET